MKKNPILEKLRKEVPVSIRRDVDFSFELVDRIHQILVNQNKNQRDLAKLLGKSEAEISKWMRGTHNFTFQTIHRIEEVLGEKIIAVTGLPVQKNHFVYLTAFNENTTIFTSECKSKKISITSRFNTSFSASRKVKSNEFIN